MKYSIKPALILHNQKTLAFFHTNRLLRSTSGNFCTAGLTRHLAPAKDWVRCGLALLLAVGGLAGFSPESRGAADTTIHLTATLISPIDVTLEWKDTSTGTHFHTVEYALAPEGPFIVLSFCPPGETKYTHPRLMPQTTFYYRVRPVLGPVSNAIKVTLPKDLTDAAYVKKYNEPEDYSWSGPKTLPESVLIAKKSVQDSATSALAAPTDFKATLVTTTVSAFQLTWTTHSSDEEGFMIETKDADHPEFTVAGLMPPKINAFGWALHPPQREASFRLRAYYYGTPSNLERITTVSPEDWKNQTAKPAAPAK